MAAAVVRKPVFTLLVAAHTFVGNGAPDLCSRPKQRGLVLETTINPGNVRESMSALNGLCGLARAPNKASAAEDHT